MTRESFAKASELFHRELKPDTYVNDIHEDWANRLDIRATTSASRGRDGKRQKYRLNVTKADATIVGSKVCPHLGRLDGVFGIHVLDHQKLPEHQLFIDDPRASSLNIEYKDEQFQCLPSTERFSAHTGVCQVLGSKSIRGGRHKLQVGDIIRFGSVGLLISEIDTGGMGASDGSLTTAQVASLIQRVGPFSILLLTL